MDTPLSVSEFTSCIKQHVEGRFSAVCIKGEISNFKEQASGHLYFTLKDETAQLSAVLFKGNTRGLSRLPKSGDQVVVKGEISIYAPRGGYQILIRELHYMGLGELLLRLHKLKSELEQRGWFDPLKKKPIPKLPLTIGVVTSPTGSVIQDILHILSRRFSGFHLILNPVKVQGEGAAEEIARAIEQFNIHKLADVLIVGRGGGSLEDLWAFNEERVAHAIYHSQIPIISAVGHETDVCIADYVADLRAPTPSAAAELAIAEKAQQQEILDKAQRRLKQLLSALIRHNRVRLESICKHPLFLSPYHLLGKYHQTLDDARERLATSMRHLVKQHQLRLASSKKQLYSMQPQRHITLLRQQLGTLISHLRSVNPKNILSKGYCIPFSENKDSIILSSQGLETGSSMSLLFHDGEVMTTVQKIKEIL